MTGKNLIWLSRLETGKDTMFISAIRKKVNIYYCRKSKRLVRKWRWPWDNRIYFWPIVFLILNKAS